MNKYFMEKPTMKELIMAKINMNEIIMVKIFKIQNNFGKTNHG
jgi:hypothetical protein